jgi:hypothetical protein
MELIRIGLVILATILAPPAADGALHEALLKNRL